MYDFNYPVIMIETEGWRKQNISLYLSEDLNPWSYPIPGPKMLVYTLPLGNNGKTFIDYCLISSVIDFIIP
jgi:hypothetical protein